MPQIAFLTSQHSLNSNPCSLPVTQNSDWLTGHQYICSEPASNLYLKGQSKMETDIGLQVGQLALPLLLALAVLIYGVLHGALIVWVWRHREHLIIPTLLFMSPVGVGACVVATVPFVGWAAALAVIISLAVGFVPVMVIVGWAILNHRGEGLR